MPRTTTLETRRRARVVSLNARLRACRRCHLAGYLDERDSVPIARDPEPGAPLPRILLVGQAPGLRATIQDRPFAGIAGDKLRAWFERGGIPKSEFYARIHFAAITRCYPGRLAGARGDRVPSPEEQALCRPWLDELVEILQPDIVLLVGLLAIRTFLGPVKSLSGAVGTATIRDGVRYLPLPHPSGVSRWLNEPENVAAVDRAMAILRGWIKEAGPGRAGGVSPLSSRLRTGG
jgi:uracil-DNA glycosylase